MVRVADAGLQYDEPVQEEVLIQKKTKAMLGTIRDAFFLIPAKLIHSSRQWILKLETTWPSKSSLRRFAGSPERSVRKNGTKSGFTVEVCLGTLCFTDSDLITALNRPSILLSALRSE